MMGARADIRSWVVRDRSVPNLARPSYLDTALAEFFAIAARLFGIESFDESDEEASVA